MVAHLVGENNVHDGVGLSCSGLGSPEWLFRVEWHEASRDSNGTQIPKKP
jgi:hypothetical protein